MEFKHYKGKTYWLETVAQHTETGEKFAIYTDTEGNTWARPLEMFHEVIEVDGKKVMRFERVD